MVLNQKQLRDNYYKNTSIESSFGFNTLAIIDGKPKICTLKEFLENFLAFREDVVIKKIKFESSKSRRESTYFNWFISIS